MTKKLRHARKIRYKVHEEKRKNFFLVQFDAYLLASTVVAARLTTAASTTTSVWASTTTTTADCWSSYEKRCGINKWQKKGFEQKKIGDSIKHIRWRKKNFFWWFSIMMSIRSKNCYRFFISWMLRSKNFKTGLFFWKWRNFGKRKTLWKVQFIETKSNPAKTEKETNFPIFQFRKRFIFQNQVSRWNFNRAVSWPGPIRINWTISRKKFCFPFYFSWKYQFPIYF